jgi:hypothetical protein
MPADKVVIDGHRVDGKPLIRVVTHLDQVRAITGIVVPALVASRGDYGWYGLGFAGLSFAGLSLAATAAGEVERRLRALPGVQDVLVSGPGEGVRLAECHLF